jgi:hypothetical protein
VVAFVLTLAPGLPAMQVSDVRGAEQLAASSKADRLNHPKAKHHKQHKNKKGKKGNLP